MAFGAITKLHGQLMQKVNSARAKLRDHKESIGEVVGTAVRAGETAAGGALAAVVDTQLGTQQAGGFKVAMIPGTPIPVNAALSLGGHALAYLMFHGERYAGDIHAVADGVGAAATYVGFVGLLGAQASGAAPSGS